MTRAEQRLERLSDEQLRSIRRGVEKESLRVNDDGRLALTPHPARLGSPLTHPHVTTDFSESQVELITSPHARPALVLDELERVHRAVYDAIGPELLWASSMPCGLPVDETIPIARYGSSNVGRLKSVYRMGLSHRYGRRMQTISGVHYNWSMQGLGNDELLHLIRNFRRQAFVLLYLFGTTPALCPTFVEDREHSLSRLAGGSLYGPHATTLRMGRLGYQSDAQATIRASFNSLEGYAASLQDALTTPWPAYEAVGVRSPGGEYMQLSTTLLQMENEFYGLIRPKRAIERGERPLHALRARGIQYVEVRCLDLDPYAPLGVTAEVMRFVDVFLLHCLLSDGAADSPAEIADLGRNQHLTAHEGRRPGLTLRDAGRDVELRQWAREVVLACRPIAQRLDALHDGDADEAGAHVRVLDEAMQRIDVPDRTPSARVLDEIQSRHAGSFVRFGLERSRASREALGLHWNGEAVTAADPQTARRQQQAVDDVAAQSAGSVQEQKRIEAADDEPFESFRRHYIDPSRLVPRH